MPDPKRIGLSGQARGIDPQRQRRNSLTTDETVAAPITLNERGQITLGLAGAFTVDSSGNLALNIAPPLTVTSNSPLTLTLQTDSTLKTANGKLATNIPVAAAGRAGLMPALDGSATKFLAGDGTYRVVPVTPTDLGYTAATRELTSSTGTDVILPLFTSTEDGLTPASGGGTTNFLRADGTWAAPAGGGGGGLDQPAVMARMAFGGF